MNSGPQMPLLKVLKQELEIYRDTLKEVSMEIIANHISEYPIFIAYTGHIDLGRPIINKELLNTNWNINASMFEEFVLKGLIQREKMGEFKAVYKNPRLNACIFVIHEGSANFVFLPFSSIEG